MLHQTSGNTKTNPRDPQKRERHTEDRPQKAQPGASHRQTQEMGSGENFQSGASQAQKAEGQTPGQPAIPPERPKQERDSPTGDQDFGESHDRPFGERNRGAGGKIDSSQRDMGQTGQNMSGRRTPDIHGQQGPYGPRRKHRGPVAPGKPLMDDWGKSDKH